MEKDAAWLNLNDAALRWMPDGSGFLWFTERSGGAELELRSPDGKRVSASHPWSPGTWAWPACRTTARSGSSAPGETPPATGCSGSVPAASPSRWSWPARRPPASRPRSPTAERSSWSPPPARARGPACRSSGPTARSGSGFRRSPLEPPFRARPEVRQVGKRGLWTSLVRPRDFQPGVKYPVIVQVYGGPTRFSPMGLRSELAPRPVDRRPGFPRGEDREPGRDRSAWGRDFERAVKGDLAGPALEDQVEALSGTGRPRPGDRPLPRRHRGLVVRRLHGGAGRAAAARRLPGRHGRRAGRRLARLRQLLHRALPGAARGGAGGLRPELAHAARPARTTRRSSSCTGRPTTTSTCSTR